MAAGIFTNHVTTVTLLIFMDQVFSPSNNVNYMAGIYSHFILYSLDPSVFRDETIHLF